MELKKVEVPYKSIVLEDGSPNEAFLAELRNSLKEGEGKGEGALICPVIEASECKDIDAALQATADFKHCARRIKDCQSVKGFAIPKIFREMERGDELVENFKSELLEKHPHYIFED
ncbi:MAG: hypothetical protein K6A42_04070 [Treponema sp.]|nr:hypothetical protein [Treponema sp.]